jgi:hypothetical protein
MKPLNYDDMKSHYGVRVCVWSHYGVLH